MRARLQRLIDVLSSFPEGRPALRRAAFARAVSLAGCPSPSDETLPDGLRGWIDRVAREAWKTTDENVAALRGAGFDEDTIFEATVAAAVGASIGRYHVAMRAIEAARRVPSAAAHG